MSNDSHLTSNITHAAAARIAEGGVRAATETGAPISVVIVDGAGHVVQASRMDGAPSLSLEIARRKAYTAAMARADTDSVRGFVSSDEGSLISMPVIPDFSLISGGLPIFVDEHCVGAVGVSGATAPMDLDTAKAALEALNA